MKQEIIRIGVLLFCLGFVMPNGYSQWRYPNAENIEDDVIITYDVIYENELSDEQKESSSFLKEIIVVFNEDKLIEKRFTNNIDMDSAFLLDYEKGLTYSCKRKGSDRRAIVNELKDPSKEVTIKEGEEEVVIGYNCQVSTAKIKGKQRKIYTTKELGVRFVKQFNTDGFLLKYSTNDKYLGVYKVTAKNIAYTKAPESTYSLEGYQIQTVEERKEYNDARVAKREKNKEREIELIGEKAPKYTVRTMEGDKFKSKGLLGKVVVLNFWFTTCGPCKKEIPQLNELKKLYEGKDVEFIAIALDQEYKIDEFVKQNPFSYHLVEDGRSVASKFEISLYPSNIIIDKEGKYQFFKTGYKKDIVEAMSYKIDKLLESNKKN